MEYILYQRSYFVFINFGGYWPSYRYRRYYWYGAYPYSTYRHYYTGYPTSVTNNYYYEQSNGTYANGVRIVKPYQLKQGDHIRMGKLVMVFTEDEPFDVLPDETEYGSLIDLDVQGKMVDSAIVVLEAIVKRREAGESPTDSAREGASEVGQAVVASTLTTVAVFIPVVFLEGVAAKVRRRNFSFILLVKLWYL